MAIAPRVVAALHPDQTVDTSDIAFPTGHAKRADLPKGYKLRSFDHVQGGPGTGGLAAKLGGLHLPTGTQAQAGVAKAQEAVQQGLEQFKQLPGVTQLRGALASMGLRSAQEEQGKQGVQGSGGGGGSAHGDAPSAPSAPVPDQPVPTEQGSQPVQQSSGPAGDIQAYIAGQGSACCQPGTVPTLGPTMTCLTWQGLGKVACEEQPRVMITDPGDAIVKITGSTICGSDLHHYHREFQSMSPGCVLGHEAVGVVAEVGPACSRVKPGDKVVIAFCLQCGECSYCSSGRPSMCDRTNGSKEMEKLYGHRTAGLFGYSELLGGYEGLQSSVARVPLADHNLLVIPQAEPYNKMDDGTLILLSDVAVTSWHACELGEVGGPRGKTVAIWGAGPIGLGAATWAKFRGATKVVVIDEVEWRLKVATERAGADSVINYRTELNAHGSAGVVKALQEAFKAEGGPDVCIDASGFRYTTNPLHALARNTGMETDSATVLNEMITACRKGGRLVLIADYFAIANGVYVGALMEKGLLLTGGQAWPQRWWRDGPEVHTPGGQVSKGVLDALAYGAVDLSYQVTHVAPIESGAYLYNAFDAKETLGGKGVLKVLLKPKA